MPAPETPALETPAAPRNRNAPRATNRLRLARVVPDAGFTGDTVRAAYEALAQVVARMIDGDA